MHDTQQSIFDEKPNKMRPKAKFLQVCSGKIRKTSSTFTKPESTFGICDQNYLSKSIYFTAAEHKNK